MVEMVSNVNGWEKKLNDLSEINNDMRDEISEINKYMREMRIEFFLIYVMK
jgi:hypothetical protein